VAETTLLLEQKFDHIFYTGSTKIGKVVMAAAAKHLTSVTLELGGKSPCIVHNDIDMAITCNRICWGKYLNCGQTCIAPDYILLTDPSLLQPFVEGIKNACIRSYGVDPKVSPDYGKIVSKNHFMRIKNLVNATVSKAADNESTTSETTKTEKIEFGGDMDEESLYIAPTIISGVTENSAIMSEEIFGPILPIMIVKGIDEAINYVNSHDKPLALYLFSNDSSVVSQVLHYTSSGGCCVNDVMMHVSCPALPFGGVGPSGTGAYHGKHSFDCFNHKKSVMVKAQSLEFVNEKIRYPAYDESKLKWLQRLLN